MSTDNKAVLDVALDETGGTQYLTFLLADEQYGLNILQVQEIRGWEAVTRVPNTPDYVKGVINLRGTIVPVLDLRRPGGRRLRHPGGGEWRRGRPAPLDRQPGGRAGP